MHRTLSLFLITVLWAAAALAQSPDIAGDWTGEIAVPGSPLTIEVVLVEDDGAWSGTIAIPAQGLRDFELSGVTVEGADVSFRMEGIPGTPTFEGSLTDDDARIEGTFSQGGQNLTFFLERADAARAATEDRDRRALEGFAEAVRAAMDSLKVPGAGIAIVRGDEIIFSEGLGLADVDAGRAVTPHTLFPIGSSTKAFTAAAVASLVDEGLLEWDTPVINYIPSFRLHDAYATREMTPVDLLVHRSGLPRHDLLWYASEYDRRELFNRLRHLEPSAAFRTTWQYQNLMYLAAGVLTEELTGQTWEEAVQQRIFAPLGIQSATFGIDEMTRNPDHARGHGGGRDTIEVMAYRPLVGIGPAGSINAGVADMARWVALQLGDGTYAGTRILGESTLAFLHTPTTIVSGRTAQAETPYVMYAPGWFVEPYRGKRMIHHGGNIDGFSALVGFMPDDDIGIVILTNKNASSLPRAAMLSAFDRLLEIEGRDWLAEVSARPDVPETDDEEEVHDRIAGTSPSHAFEAYAGTYEHPGYGPIVVTATEDGLHAAYHTIAGNLEHVHFDTFALSLDVANVQLRTTFFTNANGVVDRLYVPLELTSEPLAFTRRADEALTAPDYLADFEGTYRGGGLTFIIDLQGRDRLMVTVVGQSTWRLVPTREDAFDLDGLSGFRVWFEREGDRVVRLIGQQPGATFSADRVE